MALLLSLGASNAVSQGPSPTYFHDLGTQVPWAECTAYQPGGSSQEVPFFPAIVTHPVQAPAGTRGYSRDVRFDAPLVFVGEGVKESYDLNGGNDALDVAGAVVLMSLDAASSVTLEERVMIAARKGAVAVVVFPREEKTFYPKLKPERTEGFEDLIPVITLSRATAGRLFAAHSPLGEQDLQQWQDGGESPRRERMVLRLRCSLEGRFHRLESPGFLLLSREGLLSQDQLSELLQVNEKSVAFLLELFDFADLTWTRTPTVYFGGYDTKAFYTLHWGEALATSTGSYLVYSGRPDFGLVVHENTHTILDRSWGETTSFLTEGVAMYAQARASDPAVNHRRTIELSQRGLSVPLEQLVAHEIGMPGPATDFGYPASGSFVEYLLDRAGAATFESLYRSAASDESKEDPLRIWSDIYGTSLTALEAAWRSWLADRVH